MQKLHILRNPDFENLCKQLRSVSKSLELNECIEALKILTYIGVPINSEIAMTLLHMIRNQINDITLDHIIFLEFLLKKVEPTPLIEAFKIALPMLLQMQLGTKMDHENIGQLTDLLYFVTRNPVSQQCVMNIVSALTLHGHELSHDEARSIVWSLADLKQFNVNHKKLLENSLQVLTKSLHNLSFELVELTLTKLIDKYNQRFAFFYNEQFYNKCSSYIIDNNIGFMNAIYVQKKFNKIVINVIFKF